MASGGFPISFNSRTERFLGRHPYAGTERGMFFGPDKPQKTNHRRTRRRRYRDLSTCLDLKEAHLKLHEQNQDGKKRNLLSVCNMRLNALSSVVTLINELENCSINRA